MDLGSIPVKTRKIDDFLQEHNINKVDLIKLDAEGAEIKILAGAERLLGQDNLKIIIDIHDINREELYDILAGKGFVLCRYDLSKTERISANEFLRNGIKEIYAQKTNI